MIQMSQIQTPIQIAPKGRSSNSRNIPSNLIAVPTVPLAKPN